MRGCRVAVQEEALKTRTIHRFSGASGNNEILLIDETLLDALPHISATVTIFVRLVYLAFDEVVPAEDLFGPKFERVEEMQVASVCKSELILAILYETFYGFIIIVESWVFDKIVDAIHLHRNLPADGNFTSKYGVSKTAVVDRGGRVR
jgi:hypothetical protein